ncbi:MAG: hypothetical protein ACQEWD_06405 [Bacteroidota bacterium]
MSVIIKRELFRGAVATLVMASGTFVLGRLSGYEAKVLLESSLSGINMLCSTVILGSSTILVLMKPITESQEVPGSWYTTIYYISLGVAALLGGGLIAIITMLYGTIANIILIVGQGVTDHPLVDDDQDQRASKE